MSQDRSSPVALSSAWLRFLALTGAAGASLVGASLVAPSAAHAGGFYLLERGTRGLGRGGAQVAGADDPGALWYNVGGLGYAGGSAGDGRQREQFLIDGTLTLLETQYTRIDSGGNTLPTVTGSGMPLPIPTVAGTFDFGLSDFTFGIGVYAPNASLMQWPESIDVGGETRAAPQRYSLLSLEGSLIAGFAIGGAWRPIPELSIGIGGALIYGSFAARTTLSACDGTVCSFPEDPEYDGVAQLTFNPIFTGIGTAGVVWDPGPVRLGFSMMTPFVFSGAANIQVRPPAAAMFDGAFTRTREGTCATVTDEEISAVREGGGTHACEATTADFRLDFPWILRLGVQLDLIENLALELAVVWETWSVQQEAMIRPRDVWIVDSLGFLDFEVGQLSIPRRMTDTVSVRLGGEYTLDDFVQIRGGAYYENGAFSDEYLQALTIDSDKIVVAVGGSIRAFDGVWIDAMVGYAHLFSRSVRNSQVPQPNPIRPAPADQVFVGNGDYSMTAPFFGLGVRVRPDWSPGAAAVTEPEPVPETTPEPTETTPEPTETQVDPHTPWYQQGAGAAPPTEAAPAPEPEAAPAPASEPRRGRGRARGRTRRPR
jgi:long-chain fatty acid transport protein